MPAHGFHRLGRVFEPAWILAHHRFPQGLGAGGVGQPETFDQRGLMARSFIIIAARLLFRRTHPEPPRRYPAQLLGDLLQGELDEDAVTVLPPAAGPAGRATGRQRVPGGVDDGGSVHGKFVVDSRLPAVDPFLARRAQTTEFRGSARRSL